MQAGGFMQIITVLSEKGGAGKTTLAIHLAARASADGRRALLIDLDPQGSAALWGDRRKTAPDVAVEHPIRLERALSAAAGQGYDVVVLDTAPHADNVALRAARAATTVVMPCRPSLFDLGAVGTTLDICRLAGRTPIVVLNLAPLRSRVVDDAAGEIGRAGGAVCDVVIHQRVAFQHCMIHGQTVG